MNKPAFFHLLHIITGIVMLSVVASSPAEDLDPFGTESAEVKSPTSQPSGKGPVIPQIQFINNEITMAFQIISDATGWSIFPTEKAGKEKISMWAKNITALDLLDQVVTMAGLVYHQEENVITVMTYEEYMQYYGLEKRIVTPVYAGADSIASVIKPFLTKLGKINVHKETNSIILYEANPNLKLILNLIKSLDSPTNDTIVDVVNVQFADAEVLAKTLREVFTNKMIKEQNASRQTFGESPQVPAVAESADSSKSPTTQPQHTVSTSPERTAVEIFAVGRMNTIILKGYKPGVERARKLIAKLDVYVEPITRSYHFTYVDAPEVFKGLDQVLGISNRYSSSTNQKETQPSGLTLLEKTNSILLTGSPAIHRVMTSIKEASDIPAPFESSVIRIYKLENANVEEVAAVISDLLNTKSQDTTNTETAKFSSADSDKAAPKPAAPAAPQAIPQTPTLESSGVFRNIINSKVTVSKSTNSIIIQATAREHRELEKVIQELDLRRKQVLIKAMIVEVTTSDSMKVGVELANAKGYHIEFTSFGLSKIDPKTGDRTIIVSPGGTAAYLDTDDLSAIIQALRTNGNVHVSSEPQVLVNDNCLGIIHSVAEEPITQINASNTVATTSFAGFVEAGTQFEIIPHISEKDYLRVEYNITLNTFGARSADPAIPPPRSTSNIKSEATVPDRHTIVVGGLQTVEETESFDKVPLLGDIPLLGMAFRKQVTRNIYKTSYLFITPCIMKCKDFSDLKSASDQATQCIEEKKEKIKQSILK